jgi:hypothetical protein
LDPSLSFGMTTRLPPIAKHSLLDAGNSAVLIN